jgi:hypothetical protein
MGALVIGIAVVTSAACGGGEGPGDGEPAVGLCEGGTMSSSNALLPFNVGDVWRYRVIDPADPLSETIKRQELTGEMTPPGEDLPVIVQLTVKSTGTTESWLRREGDALIRIRQQDFDTTGALEQTTAYVPSKLRLDESPERTAMGATFQETYQRTVTDPAGVELSNLTIVDEWTVLGVDVPCESRLGGLECLHVARRRVDPPELLADKEFFFASGYGKIRETGGQIEELSECDLN